jgi:hypothetical protein
MSRKQFLSFQEIKEMQGKQWGRGGRENGEWRRENGEGRGVKTHQEAKQPKVVHVVYLDYILPQYNFTCSLEVFGILVQ